MTKEDIEEINKESPYEQGIRLNPRGIPKGIDEVVVYGKYETGGYSGGSCWDDSDPQHYSADAPKDRLRLLDLVLAKLCPNISYLQYKEISKEEFLTSFNLANKSIATHL